MPDENEMLHEIGGFEPADAKRVLAALEAAEIPFETEADHSELLTPGRNIQMYLGMYPPGSKLLIFVPESFLARAQEIVSRLFPA